MIEQVEVCGEKRRLQSVPRRSGLGGWLALVVAASLFAVIFTGHGGAQDGAGGLAAALVLLFGGAVVLQRFFRSRMLVGFDREGLYSPAHGWISWTQVTRLEVRRRGNVVTGRRTVIWLGYRTDSGEETAGEEGVEGMEGAEAAPLRWLPVNPGWRQSRTVALSEVMERCWRAALEAGAGGESDEGEEAGAGGGAGATRRRR